MISKKTYLLFALDSIHVGSGETWLGRVDNFIVREPSDGCPKIPGTSMHGAIRSNVAVYAANKINPKYLECAGQIKPDPDHDDNCPICWIFGRPTDDFGMGHAGRASIYDANILFFPINTMYGLAYITTPQLLNMLCIQAIDQSTKRQISNLSDLEAYQTSAHPLPINLGKLMLYKSGTCRLQNIQMEDAIREFLEKNLYVIDETFFVQLVNGNLDIRASVAIDPDKGIADERGPFISESIPRGTILGFDIVIDDEGFPKDFYGNYRIYNQWNSPTDVIKTGLTIIEARGLGGRTTRGMGRLKWINRD